MGGHQSGAKRRPRVPNVSLKCLKAPRIVASGPHFQDKLPMVRPCEKLHSFPRSKPFVRSPRGSSFSAFWAALGVPDACKRCQECPKGIHWAPRAHPKSTKNRLWALPCPPSGPWIGHHRKRSRGVNKFASIPAYCRSRDPGNHSGAPHWSKTPRLRTHSPAHPLHDKKASCAAFAAPMRI